MRGIKKTVAVFAAIIALVANQLAAQEIPTFNIRDVINGKVTDIQVQAVGSEMTNLALILRVTSNRTEPFNIEIPQGTLFVLSEPGNNLSRSQASGTQSFFAAIGQVNRFPGGGRPVPPLSNPVIAFSDDVTIYALCFDVSLDAPVVSAPYGLSVDSLESIARIGQMLDAFENFSLQMQQIDEKVQAGQTLTDEETRYAGFIDWVDELSQTNQTYLSKSGFLKKNKFDHLLVYSRNKAGRNNLQTLRPEMNRFTAQNVVWTMAPGDEDFAPDSVRNDIRDALHFDDEQELDAAMHLTNRFLELLNLDRRLSIIDSLTVPIDHDIFYPPFFIVSWNGPGAGWANRMTPPTKIHCWQILEIGFFIQSEPGGSFEFSVLANSNNSPGASLMNRRTVNFQPAPDGIFAAVDIADANLIVTDDFFAALFQTAADNPTAVISEAINGRAHGFDAVSWSSQPFSLFVGATVKNLGLIDAITVDEQVPEQFTLYQNYPNPFNPTTTIKFALPKSAHIKISIHNLLGQEVVTLINGRFDAGEYATIWNGAAFDGAPVSSGVYLVRMQAENFVTVKKLTLIR